SDGRSSNRPTRRRRKSSAPLCRRAGRAGPGPGGPTDRRPRPSASPSARRSRRALGGSARRASRSSRARWCAASPPGTPPSRWRSGSAPQAPRRNAWRNRAARGWEPLPRCTPRAREVPAPALHGPPRARGAPRGSAPAGAAYSRSPPRADRRRAPSALRTRGSPAHGSPVRACARGSLRSALRAGIRPSGSRSFPPWSGLLPGGRRSRRAEGAAQQWKSEPLAAFDIASSAGAGQIANPLHQRHPLSDRNRSASVEHVEGVGAFEGAFVGRQDQARLQAALRLALLAVEDLLEEDHVGDLEVVLGQLVLLLMADLAVIDAAGHPADVVDAPRLGEEHGQPFEAVGQLGAD